MKATLHVVAGALYDERGRVLISQRPPGKPLAGRWEFPGGKVLDTEDTLTALAREMREELAVHVVAAEPLMSYRVEYADRDVMLDMWIVTSWQGEIEALEGQSYKWVEPGALHAEDILEADRPIVAALASRPPPSRRTA